MTKEWQTFERSIAAFLQALDPSARVTHDAQIPDKDTGELRQRDVWIETSFGGHFPILILVSCKRKNSKLDQQDVDAFIGEFRSSNSHVGVLYSYSGYTKPALAKAKAVGISCCAFYENEAPHVPEALTFTAFCNTERVQFSISRDLSSEFTRLNDLFDLPASSTDNRPVLTVLVQLHNNNRVELLKSIDRIAPSLPRWKSSITLGHPSLGSDVELTLIGSWNLYKAKIEAYQLNGSYSFTSGNFKGSLSTPYVDTHGPHPGPGWELVNPEVPITQKNMISFILHGSDLEAQLREIFGGMPFVEWMATMTNKRK